MKNQSSIPHKAVYWVFSVLSTLLYVAWLLLLSSCEGPNSEELEESVFEGVVQQYQGDTALGSAKVVISRGEAYSQLIDDFVNPVSDTVLSDANGFYRISLPKYPGRSFYKVQAVKSHWKYRPMPFSIAKEIQEGQVQRDTLNMGTPAWLRFYVRHSGEGIDSVFIRISPNIGATGGFAFNPTIYRLYNLNADSVITHAYYYEDDPQIEVGWERVDRANPCLKEESISLIPRDTVVLRVSCF